MDQITLKTCTLDGKHIAYASCTEFFIQVGKGKKGAYSTRYKITGNFGQALLHYQAINIGNGYKKRLLVPAFNKPLIARAFSH